MEPNDTLFVVLLAAVTVGVVVFAVVSWRWRRLKATRRLSLTLLGQVLVVATLAGYVNADQDFYTSWSSLLGVEPSGADATEVLDRPAGAAAAPTKPGAGKGDQGKAAAGGHGLHTIVDRKNADKSRIVDVMLTGKRTGYRFNALVYLPGSYSSKTNRDRTFPVVELLAGYPGSPYAWTKTLQMKQFLDAEIKAGRAPAMIAVMPKQDPEYPRDSECVDAVGGAQAATYLAEDVPDAMAKLYRVRTDRGGWGLMGYSTGGFCAANLALRHPNRFSAAASLSGYFSAITDDTTGDLYKGDANARRNNSPVWTVANRRHPPLNFLLSVALDSPEDSAAARAFVKAIPARDGLNFVTFPTGGHSSSTWRAVQPKAWQWFGALLS